MVLLFYLFFPTKNLEGKGTTFKTNISVILMLISVNNVVLIVITIHSGD